MPHNDDGQRACGSCSPRCAIRLQLRHVDHPCSHVTLLLKPLKLRLYTEALILYIPRLRSALNSDFALKL
ncbi:hypothetical protein U9M48_025380 [Paspalum notatum var. saurae]|uniref:Uncharacterized protein n=1 Tax=Paspalum notatum var. saurae TaxID=547442 RepID=A0AAQ3TUU9_PASNO